MDGQAAKSAYERMIRFRTPGGALTAAQLAACAAALEEMSLGPMHLTTRASLEFHHGGPEEAAELIRRMAEVGLGNPAACGPVVRGAAVSTPLHPDAGAASALAASILDHFRAREPLYPLPKKFKVGVDAGYRGARHLIQDAGFVLAGKDENGAPLYDAWLAGGLGREPVPAFPFRSRIPETAIVPLIEAVVGVFREHGEKGKRLKHLLGAKGREWMTSEIARRLPVPLPGGELATRAPVSAENGDLRPHAILPVFAGQASPEFLRKVAKLAAAHCGGTALLTPDQDVALVPAGEQALPALLGDIVDLGLEHTTGGEHFAFRVCPGSAHCPKALCETGGLAVRLEGLLKATGAKSAAISGCPNSCAQPQLAEVGIICTKRIKTGDGAHRNHFKLLVGAGEAFAQPLGEDMTEEDIHIRCRSALSSFFER